LLDSPLDRPGAIGRVIALLGQERLGRSRYLQLEALWVQKPVQTQQLNVHNLDQI